MPPFFCASRSISQSFAALPASRQRPYQSVVFGTKVHRQLGAGQHPAVAERGASTAGRPFQIRLTNIVWVSSIGTQARLLTPVERALRRLRPEREQEIGEAPIGLARLGRAVGGVHRAPVGVGDVIFGRAVGHRPADQIVRRHIGRVDRAGMQKAEMRGVDVAFERLQPIAFALHEDDLQLAFGQQRRLDLAATAAPRARSPI